MRGLTLGIPFLLVVSGLQVPALQGQAVSVSPDGSRIVTGGEDGTVSLWDMESGRELLHFEGQTGHVVALAFSSGGRQVLTGSDDNSARLWDARTGEELQHFEIGSGEILGVFFAPDGARIVSTRQLDSLDYDAPSVVHVWDMAGTEVALLEGHTGPVTTAALALDGKRLLTGAGDGMARLWDLTTGLEIPRSWGDPGFVTAVALSTDGRWALSGGMLGTIELWNVETGASVRTLDGFSDVEGPARVVTGTTFAPDGRRIIAVNEGSRSHNRTARVWDAENGRELLRIEQHPGGLEAAAFFPGGRRILTSGGGIIMLWDAETGVEVQRFDTRSGSLSRQLTGNALWAA